MDTKNRFNPFKPNIGHGIGKGKDNKVAPLEGTTQVVKWNHKLKKPTTSEEHFNRLLYKKKKYEMLKFFLDDFIPESSFVLGHKPSYANNKLLKLQTKEYTVQKRVPDIRISQLSDEQKSDPRLLYNIHLLIQKIRAMSKIVKTVNASLDKKGRLDAELDLGGLSKIAEQVDEDGTNWNAFDKGFMNSPNLLVDPESMRLSCIDFGSGEWSDEKEAALTLIKALAQDNRQLMELMSKPQK